MHRYAAAAVLFAAVFLTTYCLVVAHQLEDRIDLEAALDAPVVASQIFARPLRLEAGLSLQREILRNHLDRLRYRRVAVDRVGAGEYGESGRAITIGQRRSARVRAGSPVESGVSHLIVHFEPHGGNNTDDRILRVTDTLGRPVDRVYLRGESLARIYSDHWVDRQPVALTEMPDHLIDAVLTVEDRRFFDLHGLDLYRTAGALAANLRSGRVVAGGSTVTQQLVKNLYLSWERKLARKALEAIIAVALEYRLTKEQILEAYLNEAYLGQRGPASVRGVGAAAYHYFGKDVADLDVGEAALLAGLIHAPGRYAPFRTPEAARARRDQVLEMMLSNGVIARHIYGRAVAQPLKLTTPPSDDAVAAYFVDYVRKELAPVYTDEQLQREGLAVVTTLDSRLQRLASRAVVEGLERLEADFGSMRRARSPLQAALVALDPATGDILAMVGGRDYRQSQFNRAVDAYRHPGSAFKPFVALAALSRRGDAPPAYTLTTFVDDAPLAVADWSGTWRPQNYDREFRGLVTVRTALEQSLNVPMARIGLALGPARVAATARALGITSPLEPVPSIVLGTSDLSLLQMTRAYATLANGGLRPEVRSIEAVRGGSGEGGTAFEAAPPSLRRMFAPDETYLVTSAV